MTLIVEPPHVDVQIARGAWVEPQAMLRQIRRAGFAAIRDDFRLVVTGTVVPDPDNAHVAIALDSMAVARTLPIAAGAAADSIAVHAGEPIEIEGFWDEKAAHLRPTAWRPRAAAAP